MRMKFPFSVVLLSYFNLGVFSQYVPDGYTLEQIQVMFRHGDRVPDKEEIYPTDPYDDLFKKLGHGQLTKIGKRREHQVGKVLKERYSNFVGEYDPKDVYAYSTDYDRTKMSLQLALAGLFPPAEKTEWSDHLLWTPVPTNYDSADENFMMNFFCSKYTSSLEKAMNTTEMQSKLAKFSDLFSYLEKHTGISIKNPALAILIFQNIRSVISLGLSMPDWCTDDIYQQLRELTGIAFEAMTGTQYLTKLIVGPVVERFLQNIKKTESPKKVYMYGGHDINVGTFTGGHNISGIPIVPDYGSAIVVEKLRGSDDEIYLRFILWTGAEESWIEMKIEACENVICPLSVYEKIVENIMPDDETKHCTTTGVYCKRTRTLMDNFNPLGRLTYLIDKENMLSFKYMASLVPKVINNAIKTAAAIPKAMVKGAGKTLGIFPEFIKNAAGSIVG